MKVLKAIPVYNPLANQIHNAWIYHKNEEDCRQMAEAVAGYLKCDPDAVYICFNALFRVCVEFDGNGD